MVITKKSTATLTKEEAVEAITNFLRSKNAIASSVAITVTILEENFASAQNATSVLKAEWETS